MKLYAYKPEPGARSVRSGIFEPLKRFPSRMKPMKCTSCHVNVLSENNFTKFKCPACLENDVIRCEACRRKSNVFVCSCGFEGP